MITALLGLLESKQDNGCFLQKMKRRFDSCFQLEMMRGTHHSQPLSFLSFLSGRPSVADTPRCNRSFSTPYQHFFLHLSPFLLLFPTLLILSCLNPSLFFCHILLSSVLLSVFVLHTCTHTDTRTFTSFQLSLAAELRSQLTCTFVMSNKLSARKRGKYRVIICTECK